MYLLYVDESGKPAGKEDRYFVVAGLAVHEQDCYPLSRSLAGLQRRRLGSADGDLELHASHMWSGRSEWARVPVAKRHGLLRAVMRHLATWQTTSGHDLRLFGVALHKDSFRGDPRERAHEELFARFDEMLTRLHRAGRSERSLVVADDPSYESIVQTLVPRWMSRGARMGRLHSFVEVPLYVSSRASRLV